MQESSQSLTTTVIRSRLLGSSSFGATFMSIFKAYEEQLINECQKVKGLLAELRDCEASSAKGKSTSLVTETEKCIRDADATIKQMDVALRDHTGSDRKALDETLTKHKTSLSLCKADFAR